MARLITIVLLTVTLASCATLNPDQQGKSSGPGPNVLLIVVDDLNLAIGAYADSWPGPGYASAKTPNIDRLAGQGMRFDRAYVQNPLCNPSRTSFLSGLRPASTDVYTGQTPPRHKIGDLALLPEHFRQQGYFTARVGKIAHNTFEDVVSWDVSRFALSREPGVRYHRPGYLPGIDLSGVRDNTWVEGSGNGMSRAEVLAAVGRSAGLPLSWRATTESPNMTPDGTTATRVIELLAEHRTQPFFIAAGFHKPHQPWVGPVQFFEQHPVADIVLPPTPANDLADVPEPAAEISADDAAHTDIQRRQAIAAYHAMVSMIDSYVGQVLGALDELGLADSTIVVFTSDHGFQLNEHGGLWRKTYQFEESTRVPLIVRLPGGKNGGQTTAGMVELVDLYPTLVDLCGLPQPAHALEGTSFRPLLEAPSRNWKPAVFSETKREGYHGRTIRTSRYRYTEWRPLNGQGAVLRELYDLKIDPNEYTNLAAVPAQLNRVTELAAALEADWQAALPPNLP
ncbi:MAG: sulfatase [Pseudomonadota bacterium]